MTNAPVGHSRPEDYGFGDEPVLIGHRLYMQYGNNAAGEAELNSDQWQTYSAYCSLDATSQWGWGVGITKAEPGVDMQHFDRIPWRQRKQKVPFFIDHMRRSTTWCKVRNALIVSI